MTTCLVKNTAERLKRYIVGKVKYRITDDTVEFLIITANLPVWRYRITKNVLLTDFNNGKASVALAFEIYKCYKSYITKLFFK